MTKYDDLTKLTVEDLIDRYVSDALDYGEKKQGPGVVAVNAAANRMGAVYSELRRRGRDAQESLFALLNHTDVDVRGWAGAHVIDFAPERMLPMLEEKAAQEGLGGWGARRTLQELKDGTLKPTRDFLYRSHPTLAERARWPTVSPDVANVLATVGNRLDAEAPDLGLAFREAPLEKRREVAVRATEIVLSEVALSGFDDEVAEAQYALRFERLPALAEHQCMMTLGSRLRGELALVERDPHKIGVAEGLRWEVHAVSALAIALTGDSTRLDEVILEAIGAHNQPEGFIPYLAKMLREPQKN